MQVDPDNRLVALELESAWNVRLKELDDATSEYEKHVKDAALQEDRASEYACLNDLSDNFSTVWRSIHTDDKDKKRIVRYLVEDVTLLKADTGTEVNIRFKGLTTESIIVEPPLQAYQTWTTDTKIVDFIREESQRHTPSEIVDLLNEQGFKSGKDGNFHIRIVQRLIREYKIPSLRQYYLDKGYITCAEKAAALGVTQNYLARLTANGNYSDIAVRINDKNEYLFQN